MKIKFNIPMPVQPRYKVVPLGNLPLHSFVQITIYRPGVEITIEQLKIESLTYVKGMIISKKDPHEIHLYRFSEKGFFTETDIAFLPDTGVVEFRLNNTDEIVLDLMPVVSQ